MPTDHDERPEHEREVGNEHQRGEPAPFEDIDRHVPLGSLTQKTRDKQIGNARVILVIIGILTILVNFFAYTTAESTVHREIDKELRKQNISRDQLLPEQRQLLREHEEQVIRVTKLAGLLFVLSGVVFVVFGACVRMYPVPITIAALVLYIACKTITLIIALASFEDDQSKAMLFNPIAWGITIAIVIALAKSIQAAVAYESRERRKRAESISDDSPDDDQNPDRL